MNRYILQLSILYWMGSLDSLDVIEGNLLWVNLENMATICGVDVLS